MHNLIGVPYRDIPVASVIDPETGEITPGEMPAFSSRVAPTANEMKAGQDEERFLLGRMPSLVAIDVQPLSALRRSPNPEVWAQQQELMGRVHQLKLEVETFAQNLNEQEIDDLKATHKALCDAARSAKGIIEELAEPLASAQTGYRDAQREWNTQNMHLANVRSQGPKAEHYPSERDYQAHAGRVAEAEATLNTIRERAEGWATEVTRLEAKLRSAQGAFAKADRAVKSCQKRIDRLTGAVPEKRSSLRGSGVFGLG